MNYTIEGAPMPVVICNLEGGETMLTEKGAMSWMSPNMKMETTTGGGIGKMFGRAFSGESMFINRYTAQAHLAAERINFTHEVPFGGAADGRVTGHERHGIEVEGDDERGKPHARKRKRGLAAGMPCAEHHGIICDGHLPHLLKNQNLYGL